MARPRYEITLSCREGAIFILGDDAPESKINTLTRKLQDAASLYRKRKKGWQRWGCKSETERGPHKFVRAELYRYAEKVGIRVQTVA